MSSQGVCLSSKGLLSGWFSRGGFCPFPFCQNTTVTTERCHFQFQVSYVAYDKKLSVTSHALDPSRHTLSNPSLERDVFYGRPLHAKYFMFLFHHHHHRRRRRRRRT